MLKTSLDEVLAYSNPKIVERFIEKNSVTQDDGLELFQETLKLLWLMSTWERERQAEGEVVPRSFSIYPQMGALDEVWHTFILFSRDYTAFCDRFFGRYLHHVPTTAADREIEYRALRQDPEGFRREKYQLVREQCAYILQKLGAGSLTRWFKDYPARFPSLVADIPTPPLS